VDGDRREPGDTRSKSPADRGRGRLIAAYAVVGVLCLAALGGILLLSSGPTSESIGDPHVNPMSGSINGVPPDSRSGTEPPELAAPGLRQAARAAGCVLRLHLPDEGHRHISPAAPEPDYRTIPPTSGNHVDEQQADGAYRTTPRQAAVVHSLEHGRLAIEYQPDLPEQDQLELVGLFDSIYGGTLLFPNPQMPYAVAAVAWTNLLGCRDYAGPDTLIALRAFGKATWGKFGGEPLTGLPPSGPTPGSPAM
jgi:hypothetical protein